MTARVGRCYELAFGYVLDWTCEQDARLVHGSIRSERPDRDRIEHAWIALGGQVWDPVLDQWFAASFYEEWAGATAHASWSPAEARREAAHRLHYGPWAGPEEVGPVDPDWCDRCGCPRDDHLNGDGPCAECDDEDPENDVCGGFTPEPQAGYNVSVSRRQETAMETLETLGHGLSTDEREEEFRGQRVEVASEDTLSATPGVRLNDGQVGEVTSVVNAGFRGHQFLVRLDNGDKLEVHGRHLRLKE